MTSLTWLQAEGDLARWLINFQNNTDIIGLIPTHQLKYATRTTKRQTKVFKRASNNSVSTILLIFSAQPNDQGQYHQHTVTLQARHHLPGPINWKHR